VPRVTTVGEALAQMTRLDHDLDEYDGVRWFNRLYLAVTQAVFDSAGTFPEKAPGFLTALDVSFANYYFDALDAAGGADRNAKLPGDYRYKAWAPLFERRRRRDVAPIQFALAGMNAHINHDLALGVQDVCRDRHVHVAHGSNEYRDFTAVNDLIAKTEGTVKKWLLTGALQEIDRSFGPVDDLIAIWSVKNAREAAWTNGEVLSHLHDTGLIERNYRFVLARTTGAYSRALLRPVGFFEGAPLLTLAA
jgi:hypothetical protein